MVADPVRRKSRYYWLVHSIAALSIGCYVFVCITAFLPSWTLAKSAHYRPILLAIGATLFFIYTIALKRIRKPQNIDSN